MAETDFYLAIDDIEGECVVEKFEKTMQIDSWSFGATNSGSFGTGTGGGTGKASMQDFHFCIRNGKASPQLFLFLATGKHVKKATLTCRETGGDANPYNYLEVEFENLVLSSFQTGASAGSGIKPMEQVSFNWAKITIKQYEQDMDSGIPKLAKSCIHDTTKVSSKNG
jgi:type VI secretion system secreted protein Hcp